MRTFNKIERSSKAKQTEVYRTNFKLKSTLSFSFVRLADSHFFSIQFDRKHLNFIKTIFHIFVLLFFLPNTHILCLLRLTYFLGAHCSTLGTFHVQKVRTEIPYLFGVSDHSRLQQLYFLIL